MIKSESLEKGIKSVIEEIRPSLAMHGGDASFIKIKDGIVHVKLEGSCQGCPMSNITFGIALKEMLQKKFPNDIKDVVWD